MTARDDDPKATTGFMVAVVALAAVTVAGLILADLVAVAVAYLEQVGGP